MDWRADDVLLIQDRLELERLEQLLGLIIPGDEDGGGEFA